MGAAKDKIVDSTARGLKKDAEHLMRLTKKECCCDECMILRAIARRLERLAEKK